ncbi:hypothetical protein H632_c3032p0, partial [Helicosporidium sp. ATCC 50920]
ALDHCRSLGFGLSAQEAKPYYLTDRLLACIYEEDRESWNRSVRHSTLSESYKQHLRELANELRSLRDSTTGPEVGGTQIVNLGPAWRDPAVYSYFNNSVMEFPDKIWERPPGLALCPLHVIFTICSQMHQWLSLASDNVVVLHARTCTGSGRDLVHLLGVCHLIYSMGVDTVRLALDTLPPLRRGGSHARPYESGSLRSGRRGRLLPAATRYAEYLCTLLHRPCSLPPQGEQPLLLRGLLCSRPTVFAPRSGASTPQPKGW